MKSQNDRILAALKAGPLDTLAAWNDYGESCRVAEYYIGQR